MEKLARQHWYYLDFRRKEILFSGSQEISYEAIPANKAMNRLLLAAGVSKMTFKEYKAYLDENGIVDSIYQFDGRSKKTVVYEPMEIDAKDFLFLMRYFPDDPDVMVSDLIGEIYRLNNLQKKGTDKRLVDIAKCQLESVIDLLKKC